jgi:hypothetical protein
MLESPEAALARNLRLLAIDPRGYEGLLGAGRASLRLGDAQTAIGFFGRAEEVNPISWVPKWGQGAALVAMEEPQAALGYFGEAQRLGASLVSIAVDRGLAFDLLGNQAAAQSDYRLALGGVEATEARRRLALSLAVSSRKAEALATLDPLLARRDPGALRARAFVLALSGDAEGARSAANVALPGMAAVLDPFFRRLPGLRPAEKVAAVHFGHFPTNSGGAAGMASTGPAPAMASPTVMPRSMPPSVREQQPAARVAQPAARLAQPVARVAQSQVSPTVTPRVGALPPATVPSSAPTVTSTPMIVPPPPARDLSDNSPLDRASMVSRPSPQPTVTVAVPAAQPGLEAAVSALGEEPRLAEIDRILALTPEPEQPKRATKEPTGKSRAADLKIKAAADAKTKAAADLKAKTAAAAKLKAEEKAKALADAKAKAAAPSRYWVQLAGGAKADRMPIEYQRIKAKKPKLFARRTPYIVELKGWARLLIGPFKSEDEAQEAVNDLKAADINAFGWASPAGQVVEKLTAK